LNSIILEWLKKSFRAGWAMNYVWRTNLDSSDHITTAAQVKWEILFCFISYILWKYRKTWSLVLTTMEISLCCVMKGKTGLKAEAAGLWWLWRLRFKWMGPRW